jgi:hypothetical protein
MGRVTEDKQFCNDLWVFSEISLEAQIYSMIDGRDPGDGSSSVGRKQGIKSIFKLDCSHSMFPVINFSPIFLVQLTQADLTQISVSQRTLSVPSIFDQCPKVASFVFNKSWRVNWDDINQRWWFHAVRCCQASRLSLSSGHFCGDSQRKV